MSAMRFIAVVTLILVGSGATGAESYSFDPTEFKARAFEVGGYAEGKLEGFLLDRDSVLYELSRPTGSRPSSNGRATGTLEMTGAYRKESLIIDLTGHADANYDVEFADTHNVRLYQGGVNLQPRPGLSLDIGKRVLLWGKGYAWNPVGFLQRPKDPTDPELSREGFWMASANYVRSFRDSSLQTAGLTITYLPTNDSINSAFGAADHHNVAAKGYLLVRDTDIDLMILSDGAKSLRYGVDFSRNLGSQMEVHGEIAHITKSERAALNSAQTSVVISEAATSYLVGIRYLTARETTLLLEYFHNGEGFRASEADAFFSLSRLAISTEEPILFEQAKTMRNRYARPTPGRDYINFKASQKDAFDIVYFTPSLTIQANVADGSALLLPELLYTGVENLELRLRLQQNLGPHGTEFGEKQASTRVELRLRYYF